jgi:poly(hydroxyalkanoate) depolymerase family esterase
VSLKSNIEFLKQLRKLSSGGAARAAAVVDSRLVETTEFGPNPGDLRMFSYLPDGLTQKMPLVVVLHGCSQTAAAYEVGAGWCTLAQRYGFALLTPEQKRANNPNLCFNWFRPDDTRRGGGETASIHQMVEHFARLHRVDRARIFVTGLSAGGAMTAAMLATYPDVFCGGAVIAGLPYGVADNVRQALQEMHHASPRSAHALGDLVRNATSHRGPWPKLSVWHGSADRTVDPANADMLVRQWLDLHGLPATPMAQARVDGYPRRDWRNASGETVVESFTIDRMAHGTPLGIANDERYGVAGAFLLEVGISSSYHIARFFGLTERIHQRKPLGTVAATGPGPATPDFAQARSGPTETPAPGGERDQRRGRRAIDVNAIVTRALTAAGLIK